MLRLLALLLPGLIPSWKFFKSIEPSPRVQWRLLTPANGHLENWQEFHPRPQQVTVVQTIKRLFWNPQWNEYLFFVSLAERLTINPTEHSRREILQRLTHHAKSGSNGHTHLQFRLVFIRRDDRNPDEHAIVETVTYESDPCQLDEATA